MAAPASVKVVVVKIGGSFLLGDGKPNIAVLRDIAETIREMVATGYRVVAVVGGGIAARQYIAAAEALGANNGILFFFFFFFSLTFFL
jgi:uridylate kinase